MKNTFVVANVVAWLMTCVAIGYSAESPGETIVSIKGMRCSGCAKKVTSKLNSVSNVKLATVDVEKGTALVLTTDGKQLSPKAVWEAVETAGYKPTEFKGPAGRFTSKPTK